MKLQNIMALGEADPLVVKASKNVPAHEDPEEPQERDLFQEGEADCTFFGLKRCH